jgi:hypothetical protein
MQRIVFNNCLTNKSAAHPSRQHRRIIVIDLAQPEYRLAERAPEPRMIGMPLPTSALNPGS